MWFCIMFCFCNTFIRFWWKMVNSNSDPLVSIIIPVYNGSNFLKQAIDSALGQTYTNIEIIVVNDGSCDDGKTENIALSYGDKIRYFKKENGGVSSALNFGISQMKGTYFSWLSHDDKYLPEKVSTQIEMLKKFNIPDLVAFGADMHIDVNDKEISNIKQTVMFESGVVIEWQKALSVFLKTGTFNGCAFLIPKTVLNRCGKFDESLRYCQDWLMWLKIFTFGYPLVYTEKRNVQNRIHDKQLTQTGREIFRKDSKAVFDMMIDKIVQLSCKEYNLLYKFSKYHAIYDNKQIVDECIKIGKEKKIFSFSHVFRLNGLKFYGSLRPFVRKIYYMVVKKVKTQ